MQRFNIWLLLTLLLFIPIYPKFPLVGIAGSFVSVRLEDFLIGIVLVFWVAQNFTRIKEILKNPIHRAIIIYLLVGFFALFSGIFLTKLVDIKVGLLHAFRRVEYMALFFIAYDFFKSKAHLPLFIRSLLVVSAIVAFYGLGQVYLGFPVISTSNSEFSKGLALTLGAGARINSTFAGHYDLAAFSVFPLLLITGLLAINVRPKWLLILLGAASHWTLLLSASRVSFASFVICAGLLLLALRKFSWIPLLVILSIVSVVLSPQLRGRYLEFITQVHAQEEGSKSVETIPDALKPTAKPEDRSFNIRLNVEWPRAIRALQKNPLFGTGFSSVGLATDNEYLRTLAETGLLGLLAFLLIFIRFIKSSVQYFLHYRPTLEHVFILSMVCGILSLLLNAVFIDVFAASKIALLAWLIIGVTEKVKQEYQAK